MSRPPRRPGARLLVAAVVLLCIAGSLELTARQAEPAATLVAEQAHESGEQASAESTRLMPTIAKVVNFAALVGFLVYFLRAPIAQHLAARATVIRRDLTDAKVLRETAEGQLAKVRARLTELPAELRALEARGQEELANERDRLKAATALETAKLLERTRRDIDLQFRIAHRQLVEHTADLAMSLARKRIERSMTADDQTRLVARYATEVRQ